MTAIKIDTFGGLAPSVDPRNLPADGAQTARNLDMRFGDFRPARGLGAAVYSAPAGTASIHRTPSGAWLTSTTDTNYVNGQINDSEYERVYLTGRSAYPEAWENGQYRRLGVPRPDAAPAVSVIVADEFDQADATAAQEAATNAVLTAVKAADSEVLLGNAVVAQAPGGVAFDPLYAQVQLHLDFEDYTGGTFVDKSPQRRPVTREPGVSQGTDNSGPLGAAGGKFGVFSGGSGTGGLTFPQITRLGTEPDRTWTVDIWLTPSETCPELIIESWKGAGGDTANPNMRKLAFIRSDGAWRTLMSNINGSFSAALRCRRANGANVLTAGVPALVSLQNNGTAVEVFIDGVKAGQTPFALGLEFSHFGRATNAGNEAFLGKVDELRVTFGARYAGNFTPSTQPYPTLQVPTGSVVAHEAVPGLPTASAKDAAYLVQLTPSGGGWAAANPAEEYLRTLPGAQVVSGGNQFWAVLLPSWRATGLTASLATLTTTLTNVVDPASPPNKLLNASQVTTLAAPVAAVYDATKSPLSGLVAALNSAQADVLSRLATAGATAAAVQAKLSALATAAAAVESYFAGLDGMLRSVLAQNASTIFGNLLSRVVTRLVETRAYIVTYVTDWGEESQPSLPSELLTLDQNDSVQITVPAPPTGRNIVGYRIYRSSTTNTGAAFQLIDAKGANNASLNEGAFNYLSFPNRVYLDTAKQEELQETCPSLTWAEPPANLKGLVGLPNGIMLGFFGKTLCACEPYKPYAWPVEYQQVLEFNIVGIGVFGQTAVALTEGFPYYASGADSASLSTQKIENPQACIAKRTIASSEGGVIFASPDGLCLAGPQGVQVLTFASFSKEDWQAAVTSGAFGAYSDGSYYLFTGEE